MVWRSETGFNPCRNLTWIIIVGTKALSLRAAGANGGKVFGVNFLSGPGDRQKWDAFVAYLLRQYLGYKLWMNWALRHFVASKFPRSPFSEKGNQCINFCCALAEAVPASRYLNELALRHLEVKSFFENHQWLTVTRIGRMRNCWRTTWVTNFKLCIRVSDVIRLEYIVIGVGARTSRINLTAHDP